MTNITIFVIIVAMTILTLLGVLNLSTIPNLYRQVDILRVSKKVSNKTGLDLQFFLGASIIQNLGQLILIGLLLTLII